MKASTIADTAQWIGRQRGVVRLVAVLDDGETQDVALTKTRRRFHVAATAVHGLDALQLRAISKDDAVIASLQLRAPSSPAESDAPASSAQSNDLLVGLTAVAKVIREASRDAYEHAVASHQITMSELTSIVRQLSERHSAAEKALLEAREQLMYEREARIADAAALASSVEPDQAKNLEKFAQVFSLAMQAKSALAPNGVTAAHAPPTPPKTPPLKKD